MTNVEGTMSANAARAFGYRPLMFAALVIVAFLLPSLAQLSNKWIFILSTIYLLSLAAAGLWFTYGVGGLLSVAHGSLVGIGAYSTVMLANVLPIPLLAVAAVVISFFAAILISAPAIRLRGHYFVIATFAGAEVIAHTVSHIPFFGGTAGLNLSVTGTVARWMSDGTNLNHAILAALVVVLFGLTWLTRTNFGRDLRAASENEDLARSVGVRTSRIKLLAAGVGGAVAGLAGFFFMFVYLYVAPADLSAHTGINYIMMVLIGGARHWSGAVTGAAFYTLLPYIFDLSPLQNQIAIGMLVVFTILVLPDGIWTSLVSAFRRLRLFGGSRGRAA